MWLIALVPILALACLGWLANPHAWDDAHEAGAGVAPSVGAAAGGIGPGSDSGAVRLDAGTPPVREGMSHGPGPTDSAFEAEDAAFVARLMALVNEPRATPRARRPKVALSIGFAAPVEAANRDETPASGKIESNILLVHDFVTDGPKADVLQVKLVDGADPDTLAVSADAQTGDALLTVEARGTLHRLARITGGAKNGFGLDHVMVVG